VLPQNEIRTFEVLIQPLLPGAYGLAYSMLGGREAAEDAVQEAAAKAWRGFKRLRKGASSQSWFFTIVANQCRDARRVSKTIVLSLFDVPEPKVADHADLVARDLDLERALARLTPQQRALLFLRYRMIQHEPRQLRHNRLTVSQNFLHVSALARWASENWATFPVAQFARAPAGF
jgi:RNA polymerase sigma-70 factor (ECF subfamily)